MVEFLAPVLRKCVENGILIVGNFGSASPMNAARRLHALAREQGVRGLRVAVVEGDDLRDRIRNLQASAREEERPPDLSGTEIIAAKVYIGARVNARALEFGRVSCRESVCQSVSFSLLAVS